MTNNDKLRRLRWAIDANDAEVVGFFRLAGYELSGAELEGMFLKDEDPGFEECPDELGALFLRGMVAARRGPRPEPEAGPSAQERPSFTNNDILKAVRVAFRLRDEDVAAAMEAAGFRVSPGELSAVFRAPGKPNYRPCGDQFLRNFLAGLAKKLRG